MIVTNDPEKIGEELGRIYPSQSPMHPENLEKHEPPHDPDINPWGQIGRQKTNMFSGGAIMSKGPAVSTQSAGNDLPTASQNKDFQTPTGEQRL